MRLRACGALLLFLALASTARAGVVEYLYAEANVGGSTGGHVALHFADSGLVFDYQNDDLDNLRVRRLHYPQFRYLYSVRGNRNIHVARVEVPDDAYESLLARFNRALLVQDKHYRVLESLQSDRTLARLLASRGPDAAPKGDPGPALRLRGSGFFFAGSEPEAGGTSPTLAALRSRITDLHGAAFLETRIEALTREVTAIDVANAPAPPAQVSETALPRASYRPSERFLDLSLKILALRALKEARPLRPKRKRRGESDDFALDPTERDHVAAVAETLEARLAALTTSRRPDWGFALLLGMARLETLRESARSGRLVLLDAIPEDASPLSAGEVERSRAFLAEMDAWSRERFLTERRAFFADPAADEVALARLEATASRHLEIHEGLSFGRPLRLRAGALAPDPAARGLEVPLPRVSAPQRDVALERSEAWIRRYEDALHERFAYQLTTHNCVTEIFDMLAESPDDGGLLVGPRPEESLGTLLAAIPFVSHARFIAATDASYVGQVPAYRGVRLEEMYGQENDLLVHLREANTLTSTIYRPNPDDSFFLFFTDDVPLLRPLYGVFNVAAGLGEMLFGVAAAPFDRGQTLWSGAKGAFFSLPELAFVNIRKGRLDYSPSDPPRTRLREEELAPR